jgi:hypothetical protein
VKLLLDHHLSHKLVTKLADIFPGSTQTRLLGFTRMRDLELWFYARTHGFISPPLTCRSVDQEHLKTSQALQRITHRGKFELLVGDILWVAEPRYRSLITTGVNASGGPVRGKVDGIARVPETTSPEFLLLAVTTTSVRDLERKFIDDLGQGVHAGRGSAQDHDGFRNVDLCDERGRLGRAGHSNARACRR